MSWKLIVVNEEAFRKPVQGYLRIQGKKPEDTGLVGESHIRH